MVVQIRQKYYRY